MASQEVRDGKSPLVEINLDTYFVDPISVANIARASASLKNDGSWAMYRVFAEQPNLLSSGIDLSGICGQIYAENSLDEVHARFSMLQDSINASARSSDVYEKISAVLAINNHITKTINSTCMDLGLCTHPYMIDSFVEDWKDLKKILANDNSALSVIENNFLLQAQSVIQILKNDENYKEMIVGITSHSVTVVNVSSLGLGYKIKPLDGYMKLSRTKTPLLLHAFNSIKSLSVATDSYVQHNWLVTSDNVVYELVKNTKLDEWMIRML
jgi:hypothetical protein